MAEYEYITKHDSPNYTPASKVRAVYGMDRKITGITMFWNFWPLMPQ